MGLLDSSWSNGKQESRGLRQCPVCEEISLRWNPSIRLYECFNFRCKLNFTEDELAARTGHELPPMKLASEKKPNTERQEEYPTEDAILMCKLITVGKVKEYLDWLEKRPKNEVITRLLGIIYSKWAFLPILFQEEQPPTIIDGISFDPMPNLIGRRITKNTLLLLVRDESQKLGVWREVEPRWTEQYKQVTKSIVQDMEAIAKGLENEGQEATAADLRKNIQGIKETNKEHLIDW